MCFHLIGLGEVQASCDVKLRYSWAFNLSRKVYLFLGLHPQRERATPAHMLPLLCPQTACAQLSMLVPTIILTRYHLNVTQTVSAINIRSTTNSFHSTPNPTYARGGAAG
jgi:hypothetical protein